MTWKPNPHYERQIRRLQKAVSVIPFKCDKGCSDCCTEHMWTWTEWLKVPEELRREAIAKEARCPYATANGCQIYEYRPVICRLHALGGVIGQIGPIANVSLACVREIVSPRALPREHARDLFIKYISLIHKEARDQLNEGIDTPLFAGPYGRFAGKKP